MTSMDDNQLIALYKSGNDDALDILFVRYKWLVSSIARTYGLTDYCNIDDIIQEGIIGLHKAINTYDKSKNVPFRAYANTCVKTAILDIIKGEKRDKHRPLNGYVPLDQATDIESDVSLEGDVIDEESAVLLRERIFAILTKPQQRLLTYYLNGYSYSEIATKLGKDIKYVDNWIKNAISACCIVLKLQHIVAVALVVDVLCLTFVN